MSTAYGISLIGQMKPDSLPSDDPFREKREKEGVLEATFKGEKIPMILGYQALRKAATDWKTFSSDAPFRVPIPSEELMRSVRQLPIETNPPDHGDFRKIVEPFFRQPREPEMVAKLEGLVAGMVAEALQMESIEIVRDFALPLQSRALTHLLKMPESEADIWVGWGIHVFHDGADGEAKGTVLERYIHQQLDRAHAEPEGEDFFCALSRAEFRGRALTRDEMVGFANLTFAGGRDTVIQTVASIVGYLGGNPAALAALREKPEMIPTAAEEFFRVVSPLTHIGRVCPHATKVGDAEVEANGRVSLCWASANRDATVFEEPDKMRLDRKPNPHVAFGTGTHNCLGALHTRVLVKALLRELSQRVDAISILESKDHVEQAAQYERRVGYDALHVRFLARR